MTIYEKIEQLKNTTNLDLDNYQDTYAKTEAELVSLIGEYIIGAEIAHQTYGLGKIVSYHKSRTLDGLVVTAEFTNVTKQFLVSYLINRFVNLPEINTIWDTAFAIHTELTTKFKELEILAKQLEAEAIKKAAEEKKAEERYQKAKAKAIKDFEALSKTVMPTSTADEFYYSLGWLATHAGTFSAALPDYLLPAFEKRFGVDAKPTVVDSRKRTVNGNPMQWAMSMKASILKKAESAIPVYLTQYLSTSGKAITDTAFIWDLIDSYGFQFGKKQDIEKIRNCIPSKHLEFFEAGLV